MDFLVSIVKVVASIFLIALFVAGAFKANPRTHRHRPMAEYGAGFICCFGAILGFYYMWF